VLPTDIDDVSLLDLAVSTSSILVTGDRALIALAGSVPILTPRSFLDLLDATRGNLREARTSNLTPDRFSTFLTEARKQTLREGMLLLDSPSTRRLLAFDVVALFEFVAHDGLCQFVEVHIKCHGHLCCTK